MPTVEPTSIAIEIAISYHATVLIQILVNIAIGEVNGIYEHTSIAVLMILFPQFFMLLKNPKISYESLKNTKVKMLLEF